MVGASTVGLQRKPPFGNLSHLNFVAHLQFVDERGQFTLGDELKEELNFAFVGGGNNRVRPLVAFFWVLHSQSRVLPGSEFEFSPRLNANHPKVGGIIRTLGNSGAVKFFIATTHDHPTLRRRTQARHSLQPEQLNHSHCWLRVPPRRVFKAQLRFPWACEMKNTLPQWPQ